MAVPRLAGAAVSATVVRDAAVTVVSEKHHLIFPRIRTKRPTMTENDGLSGAPIFVINLRSVFDGYSWHSASSFCELYAGTAQLQG
jgi:hypothetical protein